MIATLTKHTWQSLLNESQSRAVSTDITSMPDKIVNEC
jgi:hypothetical protein